MSVSTAIDTTIQIHYKRSMSNELKHKAGTYKFRDGVEFTVNAWGCLMRCNDWETVSSAPDAREPHKGRNADLFRVGMGGRYFATEKFYTEGAWGYCGPSEE